MQSCRNLNFEYQTNCQEWNFMTKRIRFNAFDMTCITHQSPGLWAHPTDQSVRYKDLDYWVDLAKLLEKGKFDSLFIADVLGVYDTYQGSADASIRRAMQVPVHDPMMQVDRKSTRLNSSHVAISYAVFCLKKTIT